MSRADVLDAFAVAMRQRRLVPPATLVADGKIHRCDVEGTSGTGDGSYPLRLDGVPAGRVPARCGVVRRGWIIMSDDLPATAVALGVEVPR